MPKPMKATITMTIQMFTLVVRLWTFTIGAPSFLSKLMVGVGDRAAAGLISGKSSRR